MTNVPPNGCNNCGDDRDTSGDRYCAASDGRPILVFSIYDCKTDTIDLLYWDVGAGMFIPAEPVVECGGLDDGSCDDNRSPQGELFCEEDTGRPIILYAILDCNDDTVSHQYWDVSNGEFIAPVPLLRCQDVGTFRNFGNGFVYQRSIATLCTVDKINWTQHLTVDTPPLEAGEYRWGLYFEHSQDNASKSMDWRLQLDGVDIGGTAVSTDDNQITRYELLSKFGYTTILTPGIKTLDVDFKLTNLTGTFQACMRDVRLEWWRVD